MLSLYDVTMVLEFVPPELIFTVLTITQRGVKVIRFVPDRPPFHVEWGLLMLIL